MKLLRLQKLLIYYTLLHTIGYFFCIYYWNNNFQLKTLGGNTLTLLASIIAGTSILLVYRRIESNEKYFWLLISLGCFSYTVAEIIWIYYENILQVEVPFPGWSDLFFMLQISFYLAAFLQKIWYKRKGLQVIKFIFDTCILMTVAIAFSWHFIIQNIISEEEVTILYLVVSVGYPVGDLILLLGAISFYLGSQYFFPKKVLFFIFSSLFVQILADTAYLYLTAYNSYYSGSLFDPLWSIALLLMGIAATFTTGAEVKENKLIVKVDEHSNSITSFVSFRLLLPYVSVIFLFIVMISQNHNMNGLLAGSALAILLVILRQIFTLLENQKLLSQYHLLNENLEIKIGERTEELSSKNQQLTEAVQKMRHLAYHDALSGLPNRRLFIDNVTIALDEAKRNNYQLAILFIDLDRFKNINDTFGHEFGDLLLKHMAKQMSENVREIDTISRQGGDEFAILFNEISSEEEVISFIHKIQSVVSKPVVIKEQELHVSMSIGVAMAPIHGDNAEELMKQADMAMYHAKQKGRNNYQFFTSDLNQMVSRKMRLENGLRKAITNGEFILHYQPQVDLKTQEVLGMEALIRWITDEGELISPGEFIPLAEENRLIIPIGEWVLYSACKQAKTWHDLGYTHLKLSVNLSPLQFLDENLVKKISSVLQETGINPHCLEIEITEGFAVYDVEKAIKKMHAIRDLNVRIAIDDFGTGYSSLMYLKKFPINTLKIAKEFIDSVSSNRMDKELVGSMISMAHSLGLTVIAEGVETRDQLLSLQELHCDEVQGYIYSKPLPEDQFHTMLTNRISSTNAMSNTYQFFNKI